MSTKKDAYFLAVLFPLSSDLRQWGLGRTGTEGVRFPLFADLVFVDVDARMRSDAPDLQQFGMG